MIAPHPPVLTAATAERVARLNHVWLRLTPPDAGHGSSSTFPVAGNSDPVCWVDSWRASYLIGTLDACAPMHCAHRRTSPGAILRPLTREHSPSPSHVRDVRSCVRSHVRPQSLMVVSMCGTCGSFPSCGRRRAHAHRRRRAPACVRACRRPHRPHVPHIAGVARLPGISTPAHAPAQTAHAAARAAVFSLLILKLIEVERQWENSSATRPCPGATAAPSTYAQCARFIPRRRGAGESIEWCSTIPVEHAAGAGR